MPNWHQILDELKEAGSTHDQIRRKYLKRLSAVSRRNVIAYYSGWLQKPDLNPRQLAINDADKNGFMSVIHMLDRKKGLDLILHTPGGDTAATESIVDYLRSMFGTDIRVFVPQIAMSAGTMIACSAKEIIMGLQSNLGPIDPQFGGIPAHGIIEEWNRAVNEITANQLMAILWQPILQKYNPTLIGECQKALTWSDQLVRDWLATGMFSDVADAQEKQQKIDRVVAELGDHALNLNHARHISLSKAKSIGLKVVALEDDPKLQDAVLSVHHAIVHTLGATMAFKVIENHIGTAFIQSAQQVIMQGTH